MKASHLILLFLMLFEPISAIERDEREMFSREVQYVINATSMGSLFIAFIAIGLITSFTIVINIGQECASNHHACPSAVSLACMIPNLAIYGLAALQYVRMQRALREYTDNVPDLLGERL